MSGSRTGCPFERPSRWQPIAMWLSFPTAASSRPFVLARTITGPPPERSATILAAPFASLSNTLRASCSPNATTVTFGLFSAPCDAFASARAKNKGNILKIRRMRLPENSGGPAAVELSEIFRTAASWTVSLPEAGTLHLCPSSPLRRRHRLAPCQQRRSEKPPPGQRVPGAAPLDLPHVCDPLLAKTPRLVSAASHAL